MWEWLETGDFLNQHSSDPYPVSSDLEEIVTCALVLSLPHVIRTIRKKI